MATEDFDPHGNFYFSLEIDGVEVAHFMEFSGLKTSSTPFEVTEGGRNGGTVKLPGPSKYENVQLRYATNASQQLAAWRDEYITDAYIGNSAKVETSGAVVMYNNKGEELRRYSFMRCWPVSWEGPQMAAGSSALAIETLEMAFDGLIIDGGAPPEVQPQPEPEPAPPSDKPLATEPIPFEFDSDQMKPGGEEACDRVHESIKEQDPPPSVVWIEGHTCTQGSWAYNLSLSSQRAFATAREMRERAKKDGLNTSYISEGFSYRYPVASNMNEPGRQQNRRTEFYDSSFADRGRLRTDPGQKPKGP